MLNFTEQNDFLIERPKLIDWNNDDISDYYGNIPIEEFRELAITGGFEDGADIELIYQHIAKLDSILDIGSAYGRVIKKLIAKKYGGKIYSIERSKNFYNYLIHHYSTRASIFHGSLQNVEFNKKVSAILWMWSGINDFPKEEQLAILQRLSSWLQPGGTIILETLLHTVEPINASFNDENSFTIFSKYGTIYSHKTSAAEVDDYSKKLGFPYTKHIHYKTATQRQRVIHILSHHPI